MTDSDALNTIWLKLMQILNCPSIRFGYVFTRVLGTYWVFAIFQASAPCWIARCNGLKTIKFLWKIIISFVSTKCINRRFIRSGACKLHQRLIHQEISLQILSKWLKFTRMHFSVRRNAVSWTKCSSQYTFEQHSHQWMTVQKIEFNKFWRENYTIFSSYTRYELPITVKMATFNAIFISTSDTVNFNFYFILSLDGIVFFHW